MLKPYPYQQECCDYAYEHHYSINGCEMGLGKTIIAIMLMNKVKAKTLIICPAFLRDIWHREINLWGLPGLDYKVISYGSLKGREKCFKTAKLVICDEVHYIKNPKALRTKALHYYINTYKPERFLGLSGTPIKNRVTEFYSLLAICSYNPKKTSGHNILQYFPSYYKFCEYFSNPIAQRFNGFNVTTYEGVQNVPHLRKFLQHKYKRFKAKDVLDLPEVSRIDRVLNKKESKDLLKAYTEYIKGDKDKHFISLKSESASSKVTFTVEYAKTLLEQGEAIVIVTDHIDSAVELNSLIPESKMFNGKTDIEVRNTYVKEFQEGKIKILIGTTLTIGVGYTLTKARHLVFNDIAWVPGDILQVEKRIHRIGQDRKCFIHRIIGGPIDYIITKKLTEKMEVIEKVV